jgi:hypothetical protein
MNQEKSPGHITATKLVKDRDDTKVSTEESITLSEPHRVYGRLIRSETSTVTGYAILREEEKNRPTNEDAIRGLI